MVDAGVAEMRRNETDIAEQFSHQVLTRDRVDMEAS